MRHVARRDWSSAHIWRLWDVPNAFIHGPHVPSTMTDLVWVPQGAGLHCLISYRNSSA